MHDLWIFMAASQEGRFEVGEDAEFQRLAWRFQNVGFVLLLLFLAAGMLGIFGGGGIFARTTASAGEITIDYDRFARFSTSSELEVTFLPQAPSPHLIFDRRFFDGVDIEKILPAPLAMSEEGSNVHLIFSSVDDGFPMTVKIFYKPHHFGPLHGHVKTNRAGPSFTQFISP